MSPLLPEIRSADEYRRSDRNEARYLSAIEEIRRREGLGPGPARKFPAGSQIVFEVGSSNVVKLFEPILADDAEIETRVLQTLEGALPIPTPALQASGSIEGWRYVVMERMRGVSLDNVAATLPPRDRRQLCCVVGEALQAMHTLSVPSLPGIASWPEFLDAQLATAVDRQRSLGVAESLLAQCAELIERFDRERASRTPPSLLHTEVMPAHLFVEEGRDGWRISGMIDFESAWIGAPRLEIPSVGIFLSAGDGRALDAFLQESGMLDETDRTTIAEEAFVYTLVHRFANLPWYLREVPPDDPDSIASIIGQWFGSPKAP